MNKTLKCLLWLCLAAMLLVCLSGCGGAAYDYADEIAAYRDMLTQVKNGEELAQPKNEKDEIATLLYDIGQICEPDTMGYALKDINRDGTDELVLMNDQQRPYALLTAKGGKAVLLWDWVMDGKLSAGAIDANGYFYGREEWDFESEGWCTKVMCIGKNGKPVSLDYGARLVDADADPKEYTYFVAVGGEEYEIGKMDAAQYIPFEKFGDFTWNHDTLTAEAGFYYVSALGEPPVAAEGAYEVDFSSYDAIIKTYRQMLPYLTESLDADTLGQFAFSDHVEYETFYAVFKAAGAVIRGYRIYDLDENGYHQFDEYYYPEDALGSLGYALYDVNHDGNDELLLMADDYTIFALFALQKGKPVLLFDGDMTIGEDGVIRTGFGEADRYYSDYCIYEIDEKGYPLKTLQFGYLFAENIYGYRLDGDTFVPISESKDVWEMYLEHFVRVYPHTRPDIMPTVITEQGKEFTRSVNDISFVQLESEITPQRGTIYCNFRTLNPTDDEKLDPYNELIVEEMADGLAVEWSVYNSRDSSLVEHVLSGTAYADGDTYVLEADGWRIRLVFHVSGVWFKVEQSAVDEIEPWSFRFGMTDSKISDD
ncbi:MAG: hypothetical protein IJW40_01080 [Clostridia bacterium]|nr:hypothetical protein [Clostridia bacterium]